MSIRVEVNGHIRWYPVATRMYFECVCIHEYLASGCLCWKLAHERISSSRDERCNVVAAIHNRSRVLEATEAGEPRSGWGCRLYARCGRKTNVSTHGMLLVVQ